MTSKDDSEEGIDKKMALHFYSRFDLPPRRKSWKTNYEIRFLLGNLLLPKIEKAVERGEDGRVLSVLAAGYGGPIDMDDLGLKKSYGLKRKADSATTYNDLMVEVFFFYNVSILRCIRNSRSGIPSYHSHIPIPDS
jgi:hypothetical protein